MIAFYNGLAVKAASEKDDNRFPDEYRFPNQDFHCKGLFPCLIFVTDAIGMSV